MKLTILENHALLGELLGRLCRESLECDEIEVLSSGDGAVEACVRFAPDIVLLGIDPPGLSWLAPLLKAMPRAKVIALSSSARGYELHRCEQLGVHGFVDMLRDPASAVVDAVRAVCLNQRCFSASWTELRSALRQDPFSFPKVLSEREQELLGHMDGRLNDDEISAIVNLKPNSVRNHRQNIIRKLGLKGRSELMRYAAEHGFTPLENAG